MNSHRSGWWRAWVRRTLLLVLVSSLAACAATPSSAPAPPPTATLPMPITRDTAQHLLAAIPNATAVSIYVRKDSSQESLEYKYALQRAGNEFVGQVSVIFPRQTPITPITVPICPMQTFLATLAQTTPTDLPFPRGFSELHGIYIYYTIIIETPDGQVGLQYKGERSSTNPERQNEAWQLRLGFSNTGNSTYLNGGESFTLGDTLPTDALLKFLPQLAGDMVQQFANDRYSNSAYEMPPWEW